MSVMKKYAKNMDKIQFFCIFYFTDVFACDIIKKWFT